MTGLSAYELAYCAGVIFFAYGLRGSTGFGAVIGMPLLALVLPLKVLVPVWTLLGFASSAAIVARDYKQVARAAFISFIPWCVLGIAIGLYFFTQLDSRMLAQGLGTLVIAYAAFAMWNALRPRTRTVKLLLLSTVRGIGYYAAGEFTPESWLMFGAAFPAMLAGMYVGDRIHLQLSETTFRRFVCATLLLCGAILWLK